VEKNCLVSQEHVPFVIRSAAKTMRHPQVAGCLLRLPPPPIPVQRAAGAHDAPMPRANFFLPDG
jgi:hypothetical protein